MAGYHNDYTCSMYDFYMLTGEGSEYFEDTTEEYQEECQEECQEESQEELYFETFDDWLDYNIERLEAEIAEKKRIIAEQNAESK